MKKYIKYFIFTFIYIFTFIPNVFAYAQKNTDTYYNLTPYDIETDLQNIVCDGESLYDYLISFVNSYNSDSSNYNIIISPTTYRTDSSKQVQVHVIPKDVDIYFQWFGGETQSHLSSYIDLFMRYYSSTDFSYFTFSFSYSPTCTTKYSEHTQLDTFLDYLNNGTIPSDYSLTGSDIFRYAGIWTRTFNYIDSRGPYYVFIGSNYQVANQRINGSFASKNNSNIDLQNVLIPFYSSTPLVFGDNTSISFNNDSYKYYVKSFNFVDYDIEVIPNEIFPTYSDLFGLFPEGSSFIEYKSQLGTIYTSFPTSQYNSFNLNITFNTHDLTALQYNQNLNYTWNCYGRINHNNDYYTYIQFPYCDFENNGNYVSDSNLLNLTLNNFVIYDSNDNPISDFSSYDKLYFYIDFQYKNYQLNKVVSNLSINFNGNVYYTDDFRGPIYETFSSLPSGFKLFFSTTKNDYSNFYGKYVANTNGSLFSIYRQEYNTNTLNTSSVYGWLTNSFVKYSVNNKLNKGIMFYQNPNSLDESTLYSLEFVIFQDMVISFRNSSSNDFYYSDSTGSIVNHNITIDYSNVPTDNYDLTYYLERVDNFIEDLSSSSLEIANLTQSFYDGLPIFFQTFIFVIFILTCVYFTYLIIRK